MNSHETERSSATSRVPHDSIPSMWIIASVVTVTAVSLAAAHAPPRIRLIGLFAVSFGLIVGWLLCQLTVMLDARPSRRILGIVAAFSTFVGLAGSTWETARLDQSIRGESAKNQIARRLIEQASSGDMIPIDSSALSTFRWYLTNRIRQIGHWTSPWPELFWCAELVAASVASLWISTRSHATDPTVLP